MIDTAAPNLVRNKNDDKTQSFDFTVSDIK